MNADAFAKQLQETRNARRVAISLLEDTFNLTPVAPDTGVRVEYIAPTCRFVLWKTETQVFMNDAPTAPSTVRMGLFAVMTQLEAEALHGQL